MMQHTTRFFYLLSIYLLFTTTVYSSTDLACADRDQDNTDFSTPWACPGLGKTQDTDSFNAILSDVDVETGQYTCEYHYKDSHQVATACTYISTGYKESLDETRDSIKENVSKIITTGTPALDSFDTYYEETLGTNSLVKNNADLRMALGNDLPELIDIDDKMTVQGGKWDTFHTYIQESLDDGHTKPPTSLHAYVHLITQAKGYMKDLDHAIDGVNNPKDALTESYEYFVQPYTPSGTNTGRGIDANDTFSSFITSMITLDTDVVFGYNKDGTLELTQTWEDRSKAHETSLKTFIEAIVSYFTGENSSSSTINTDRQSITSWVSIFTQKIWGFYYNLQRRFDLGYDIISTQLLFIMMVFFAMSMAARGGARYITNRENGHSSGEVKINEASIMKTLGILAAVFTFYISVPDSSFRSKFGTDSNESRDFNNHEMRTNSSLAKEMIRYAMKEGSDFGTMMSDLGTDAFLNYVVSMQGLENKERENVIKSMMSMAYYFPAYQIANTCRMQYGTSDLGVVNLSASTSISKFFNKNYKDVIPLTISNSNLVQINGLSDRLCRQMFLRTDDKLEEVAFDFAALLEMIHKDMYVRMNATYALVKNHIELQKALGWMNIASIPYTYFIMKNENLFYDTSINYEKIEEETKQFASNLGLQDSNDVLNETAWIKDITESKSRVSNAQTDAKGLQEQYTRYAVYNFLPGFSSIRNEILQRMQSLYSDILRLRQNNQSGKKSNNSTKLNKFKKLLLSMVSTAQRYYKDSKMNPAELKKLVRSAIPSNNVNDQRPVKLHEAFIKISYLMAAAIWKSGFIIVFLSAIAMVIGLKIVLYIINIMVHFFISPFIVVWAFATSTDGGMAKIKNYLRDTLIYMLYPTIIVIGVFMFIFAYELFYSIYGFITSMLIHAQETNISVAITGNPNVKPEDSEMAYLAIYALKDITEILIDLLSVYVAFLTINKFPELVLKMMGVSDSAVIMLPQASEAVQSKGSGSVNPLSR